MLKTLHQRLKTLIHMHLLGMVTVALLMPSGKIAGLYQTEFAIIENARFKRKVSL